MKIITADLTYVGSADELALFFALSQQYESDLALEEEAEVEPEVSKKILRNLKKRGRW